MASLGRRLREERVRQGLQVSDIAERTRIALRHLEAIEEDRLDQLPAGYFRRSFLRQYANTLGITGPDLDAALHDIVAEPAQDELARAIMDRPERPPQRPPRRSILAWTAPAVLLAAGSGAYLWWKWRTPSAQPLTAAAPGQSPSSSRRTPTPEPPPQPAAPTQPTASPEAAPEPTSPPIEASAPPSQAPAQASTTEPSAATASGTPERLSLNLSAVEQTWISLAAEGKTVFTGVLAKGETKTLEGAEQARLVVGNAGGLEVRWNGKVIEPIGPRGHIREVVFTRANYRIRVLRKPES